MAIDPHALGRIVSEVASTWSGDGISLDYHAANDKDRPKFACYVQAESSAAVGQLTVWNSGELDIDGGYIESGDTFADHCEVATEDELRGRVEELRRRLLARP